MPKIYKKKPVYIIEMPPKKTGAHASQPEKEDFWSKTPPTVHPPVHHEIHEEPVDSSPPWKVQELEQLKTPRTFQLTKPSLNKKAFSKLIFIVVIAVFFLGAVYLYTKQSDQLLNDNPALANLKPEEKLIIANIIKNVEVPSDEVPQIAVINDLAPFANQPIFRNVMMGDLAILYPKAEKAVFYRPTTGKIITAVDIKLGSPTPAPEVPKTYTVTLRNGTTRVGLTNTYEQLLFTKAPNLTVTEKENAAHKNYEETVLVVPDTFESSLAQQLAATLEITLAQLPPNENPSSSEILIILGVDQL